MKSVYEGDSVMILWSGQLSKMAAIAFTLPTGERLVHIPKHLGLEPGVLTFWTFHPLYTWLKKFDNYLYSFKETGLMEHWDSKLMSVTGVMFQCCTVGCSMALTPHEIL